MQTNKRIDLACGLAFELPTEAEPFAMMRMHWTEAAKCCIGKLAVQDGQLRVVPLEPGDPEYEMVRDARKP